MPAISNEKEVCFMSEYKNRTCIARRDCADHNLDDDDEHGICSKPLVVSIEI